MRLFPKASSLGSIPRVKDSTTSKRCYEPAKAVLEISKATDYSHKQIAYDHISDVKSQMEKEQSSFHNPRGKLSASPSLFRHVLSSNLHESDLSTERLSKEAQVLLGAGTVSTARTLEFISYYIITRPLIRESLAEELREAMNDFPAIPPSWSRLEKLPYLQSLIKEGLR